MTPLEQMKQVAAAESARARSSWVNSRSPTTHKTKSPAKIPLAVAEQIAGCKVPTVRVGAKRGKAKRRDLKARYSALTHLTQAEAARRLGMSSGAISMAAKRYGLTFAPGKPGPKS